MAVTETMLLIALRQKNWNHAKEIAAEIINISPDSLFSSLIKLCAKASKDDKKAQYLLTLWAGSRWQTL